MDGALNGKRVAILATNGFEYDELIGPCDGLTQEGAKITIVSLEPGTIKGWKDGNWSGSIPVDETVSQADPSSFDALVIPGGVINPDKMRMDPGAVRFVRAFFDAGKPIGAICHGPWMLVEANVVQDRTLTSWPSLKTDIANAGGNWVDEPAVVDEGLVTSRNPGDIPEFNRKLIEEIQEGAHVRETAHPGVRLL